MLGRLWDNLFLIERPSIGLSFFRISVALTAGFHVIPSFFHMDDNYYHTAFKELNGQFFMIQALDWVQKSPDSLVTYMAALFCVSFVALLIGFRSQISCIVLTTCCYYFYALNAFFIGTLSWDILLVVLFLMCVTPYHGDYFSVDCLMRNDPEPFRRRRPFFLQRLLQMQIASVFFYTALYKITAQGNWLHDNPVLYLMNGPASGVAKHFLLKEWMAARPEFCYVTGLLIVGTELLMPLLLFFRKTRVSAIYLGIIFHVLLILTLDVPAIFFFLFPAQLLLFINPEHILRWIERQRTYHQSRPRPKLLYDGKCGFCLQSVHKLKIMDLFGRIDYVDFRSAEDVGFFHPRLNLAAAKSRIHLVESDEDEGLQDGFYAFRRMAWLMPMLFPMIQVLYFPGAGILGPVIYGWFAKNRFAFHRHKICKDNACFLN